MPQVAQLVAPAGDMEPAAHCVQLPAPAGDMVPAAHCVGELHPPEQALPPGQRVQATQPHPPPEGPQKDVPEHIGLHIVVMQLGFPL